MWCRVKSSRVTGWSGIECNCNGRRTRRTVAHSELFAVRRGAAVVGTVRAAHVANRALSITFQVLSDGWVTGVDSGERFLMAATKTALFTGPRRIPGNRRSPLPHYICTRLRLVGTVQRSWELIDDLLLNRLIVYCAGDLRNAEWFNVYVTLRTYNLRQRPWTR